MTLRRIHIDYIQCAIFLCDRKCKTVSGSLVQVVASIKIHREQCVRSLQWYEFML